MGECGMEVVGISDLGIGLLTIAECGTGELGMEKCGIDMLGVDEARLYESVIIFIDPSAIGGAIIVPCASWA